MKNDKLEKKWSDLIRKHLKVSRKNVYLGHFTEVEVQLRLPVEFISKHIFESYNQYFNIITHFSYEKEMGYKFNTGYPLLKLRDTNSNGLPRLNRKDVFSQLDDYYGETWSYNLFGYFLNFSELDNIEKGGWDDIFYVNNKFISIRSIDPQERLNLLEKNYPGLMRTIKLKKIIEKSEK